MEMGYVRTVPRGGFCVVGKRRESPSGVRFAREKARAKIGIDDSPSVPDFRDQAIQRMECVVKVSKTF